MAIKLNADIRSVAGKGAARSIRKNKNIPAVIYGEKKAPVAIELNGQAFEMLIRQPGFDQTARLADKIVPNRNIQWQRRCHVDGYSVSSGNRCADSRGL